jgi:hypothetical protein
VTIQGSVNPLPFPFSEEVENFYISNARTAIFGNLKASEGKKKVSFYMPYR